MTDMKKRYWWLRLPKDFFTSKRIKKLRKIAGGDTYTIIYLKMQLLSLQTEGMLFFDNVEDSFAEEIALDINENSDDVAITINYLIAKGLMIQQDEHTYSLPYVKDNIGCETAGAERVRKHRERIKMLHCNTDVTEEKQTCNVEKEIEIEKELDIDKKIYCTDESAPVPSDTNNQLKEIIDHLNQVTGSKYTYKNKSNNRHIIARLNEGFTVDDFKAVINHKAQCWLKDKKMAMYLRPETLFGSKFESYLNEKGARPASVQQKKYHLNEFESEDAAAAQKRLDELMEGFEE